jgi:hypothetical protein
MEVLIRKLPRLAVVWFFIALTAGVGLAQNHVLKLDGEADYVELPGEGNCAGKSHWPGLRCFQGRLLTIPVLLWRMPT